MQKNVCQPDKNSLYHVSNRVNVGNFRSTSYNQVHSSPQHTTRRPCLQFGSFDLERTPVRPSFLWDGTVHGLGVHALRSLLLGVGHSLVTSSPVIFGSLISTFAWAMLGLSPACFSGLSSLSGPKLLLVPGLCLDRSPPQPRCRWIHRDDRLHLLVGSYSSDDAQSASWQLRGWYLYISVT